MEKFRSQYCPRRPKKFKVAKKMAASSPIPVLTSPDPGPDAARYRDTAHPMDTVPTPMDTASTPTTLLSYVASKSMKKIRLAIKYSNINNIG